MKGKTFVVGDIHGGLVALQQVLERAAVTKKDTLIFLGDYVDGWSESAGVIDFLMQLEKKQHCIFLLGNHDQWCLEWLRTQRMSEVGYQHGGKATIASYEKIGAAQRKKHIRFFEKMKYYLLDEQNRLFVHAGFVSMHGPARDSEMNLIWDRTLWEMAMAMDKTLTPDSLLYPKRLKLFHEIYIGHTPSTNYEVFTPIHVHHLWNIDTGAAFNGSLTLLDIDSKQFWQSDRLQSLYPNEIGRIRR